MTQEYPDDPVADFPRPPRTVTDRDGREIAYEAVDADAAEAIRAMYRDFDPADRAQGIPPARDEAIERWVDTLLADGVNVVARHGVDVVGHATLVPDTHGENELAIFVHQEYQNAGIGTELIRSLLGQGQAVGIERVWLTVERWNDPAIGLYRKVGFETSSSESFEIEMAIRI